jgi:hypothetical protein
MHLLQSTYEYGLLKAEMNDLSQYISDTKQTAAPGRCSLYITVHARPEVSTALAVIVIVSRT